MKKLTKMMPHCLTPDISVAGHAKAPPGLATIIHVRLIRILLSKTTKTRDWSFHFISFFYFISFHLISFHCVLFIESFIHPVIHSFIHSIPFHFISFHFISFHFISSHFIPFHFIPFHSFNHAFHGCAFQASLSAGLRSSVKAFPQRHFGPLPTKFLQTRMITCCIRVLGSFGQHITLGVQDFVHQPVSPVEISHAYTIKKHHQVEARFFISHVNRRMRPIKQYDATRATKMPDGGMCEVDEIWTEKCFC